MEAVVDKLARIAKRVASVIFWVVPSDAWKKLSDFSFSMTRGYELDITGQADYDNACTYDA